MYVVERQATMASHNNPMGDKVLVFDAIRTLMVDVSHLRIFRVRLSHELTRLAQPTANEEQRCRREPRWLYGGTVRDPTIHHLVKHLAKECK